MAEQRARLRELTFRRHLAFCVLALIAHQVAVKLHFQNTPSGVRSVAALSLASNELEVDLEAAHNKSKAGPREGANSYPAKSEQNKELRLWMESGQEQQQQQTREQGQQIERPRRNSIEDSTLQSAMNDDDDDFNLISYTLSLIGYYLPNINLNFTLMADKQFIHHQLDVDVEDYYEQRFRANMTLDELQFESIKAAMRMAPMPLHTSWGYESSEQLRVSSWPVRDHSRCAAHLSQLANRLARLAGDRFEPGSVVPTSEASSNQLVAPLEPTPPDTPTNRKRNEASPVENFEAQLLYKSTDIHFHRYLDTFGRVPSDLLRGNTRWYGSYSGCLDTKLTANPSMGGQTKRIKFRYCLAALRSSGWSSSSMKKAAITGGGRTKPPFDSQRLADFGVHTADFSMGNFFIRVGACLPQSCDSSAFDYEENVRNIEKLVKFNLMRPFNSDHYYLSDLYCIPDQRSPLRSIPLMGKVLIGVSLVWLSLILLATTVHLNVERFYRKAVKEIRAGKAGSGKQESKRAPEGEEEEGRVDESELEETEHDNNEFKESDILQLKHYWIRLNVYIFDHSKKLVDGVDLIACLSLYSNWLKYTKRLKLAVAQLNAEEERRERQRVRDERLVEGARNITQTSSDVTLTRVSSQPHKSAEVNVKQANLPSSAVSSNSNSNNMDNVSSGSAQRLTSSSSPIQQEDNNKLEVMSEEQVERELTKRQEAKDDFDEFESDFVKKRVDTSSLNALKVIALIWIIAGHCIFYLGSTVSNGAILNNYVRDLIAFALANGAMYITELFFVITGCLTAYLAFKYNTFRLDNNDEEVGKSSGTTELSNLNRTSSGKLSGRRKSRAEIEANEHVYLESRMFRIPFWLSIAINRYLRIMPTYLLVYSFVKLINVYIGGSGQLWDYAVSANSMRRRCVQESWLPVLTLTTNFVSIYDHCIVGGWYLSVDMQFMLLAVPLLIVLAQCQRFKQLKQQQSGQQHFAAFNNNKQSGQQQLTFVTTSTLERASSSSSPRASFKRVGLIETYVTNRLYMGYLVVFLAGILSALISMIHGVSQSDVDLSIILKFVPHTMAMLTKNIAMYTNSLFRLRAFAFGLILGHLLYLYEFKLIKLPKFIQQHGAKVTSVVFSIGFCIMFSPVIYPKGKILISHDMTAILMILTAGGIDIFLCILIFLICIGKAPKIVLFILNSPFWSVLSSLSLCAFLVHTEVIVSLSSQLNPPPTVQYSLLLFVFSATLILTYLLALALYLCFEMPVSRLIEAFMRKFLGTSKIVQSDNPKRS